MKTQTLTSTALQSLMLGVAVSVLVTGALCILYPNRFWDAVGHTKRLVQTNPLAKTNIDSARYSSQPKEQIPALFKALDRFKKKGYKVLYDGHEYNVTLAFAKAKQFINDNYKNEELAPWIKTHLYRSRSRGEIIYMKYPNGHLRPLRDVIVEVLHTL